MLKTGSSGRSADLPACTYIVMGWMLSSRSCQIFVVQVTAYYAPQFEALRELVVEGGPPVFTACLSRCKKWLSRGGKSAVYFAKTRDERYVVKQLTRSEKQSFLDFAPAYFRSGSGFPCAGDSTDFAVMPCICISRVVLWIQRPPSFPTLPPPSVPHPPPPSPQLLGHVRTQ